MRNLKRTLSLALSAVMLMGTMVVGAGAASKDFTDAGEIKNVEAVDVMVALGILEGGDNGAFQPDTILTREQAAKIICYMLMGPDNAEKLATSGAVFNDVAADRWSAPYIAYCVNMGILAGDGQGNFFPEGKLTGAAFAKMLLVALGYDADTEKYVGDSWTINVATSALKAGILPEGLVLTDELSRQNAAQMAFQTLTATMVEYKTAGSSVVLPDGTQIITSGASASKVENDKNAAGYDDQKDGYQQFCEEYFSDLKKITSDETDAFGRPGYTWEYDKKEVTFVAEKADYSIVVDEADKTVADWAKEATSKKDLTYTGTVYEANGLTVDASSDKLNVGDVVEFYLTDKNVDTVVVTRYTAGVITDVDTDVKKADAEEGVSAYVYVDGTKYFNTEIAGYNADTYVEDAVIALVKGEGDYAGEIIASYVTETVEGSITAYTTSSYTIDGTKYTMTATADDEIAQKVDFKEGVYKLYLDNNGYVIKTEVVEGTSTIGDAFYLVTTWVETSQAYNETTYTYYAQIVNLDGTVEEIEIASVDTSADKTAVDNYLKSLSGAFYTDTKTETGKDSDVFVKLAAWDSGDDYTVAAVDFDKDDKIKADDKKLKDTYYLNDKTVYVVVEGNGSKLSVTTKTGGVSFTATADADAAQVIYTTENGSKVANYVVITTGDFAVAETGEYIYVAADTKGSNVSGGFAYTVYDMEGNEVEIVEKDAKAAQGAGFYTYSVDEDNLYTLTKVTDSTVVSGATYTSYYGDLLTSSAFKDFDTANAVIVDTHDTDGDYSKSVTSLADMQEAAKAGYTVTFDAVVDTNDETVTFIVVTDVVEAE